MKTKVVLGLGLAVICKTISFLWLSFLSLFIQLMLLSLYSVLGVRNTVVDKVLVLMELTFE